ncbi:MAG: hypothetical protein ACI8ZB_002021 [Desulforhopalus sp.]|jgi:hypothetical protein
MEDFFDTEDAVYADLNSQHIYILVLIRRIVL